MSNRLSMIINDNIPYLFRIPPSDFPTDVLKWMKKNATPKMAVKLMKCHKCFQHKIFPYYVCKEIGTFEKGWCCNTVHNEIHIVKDMYKVERKFWIIEKIRLSHLADFASIFISKIAVCDIKILELFNQKILFCHFKILTASENLEKLHLRKTNIIAENGDPVLVDSMLECVPKIKHFCHHHDDSPFLPADFNNCIKENNISNLEVLELSLHFDPYFEQFEKFIEEHPRIKYHLEFINSPRSLIKKMQFKKYIQNILNAGVTKNPPPLIFYPGQPQKQVFDLYSLRQLYNTKNRNC